jgi:hypothetical protein
MENPSRASSTAGRTSASQGSDPCSSQARRRPATVPGTPTALWLRWWIWKLYSPFSSSHMSGVAAAGAFSRKS